MDHRESSPETVVIPISGVFNFEMGPVSSAQPLFMPLSHHMESQLEVRVAKPIVLRGLGIVVSIPEILRSAAEQVTQISDRYPNAHKVILGHSYGGIIGKALVEHCSDLCHVDALMTINTPHDGADPNHWPKVVRPAVERLNRFARDLEIPTPPSRGGPHLALVGSLRDTVVEPESSLPDYEEALRQLLKNRFHTAPATLQHIATTDIGFWPEQHSNVLVARPAVIGMTQLMGQMLVNAGLRPSPDTHGHHHHTLADIA